MDIPLHSNQIDSWKTLVYGENAVPPKCSQAPPAGRFQESTCHFFRWQKRFGGHVIEYLLLAIEPINLFLHLCNILELNLKK